MTQARKHRGVHERIMSRIVVTDSGCWEYPRNRTRAGYARISVDGFQRYVHRVMFELRVGRLAEGECVCHRCDNPPCCNPGHLFAGTIATNNKDMWAKGRGKLTPPAWRKIPLEELPNILSRYANGEHKRDIAETYGVSRQAIHHLLRREGVA